MLVWLLGLPLLVFGTLEDDDVVVLKKNTFDAFIRKVFSILIGYFFLVLIGAQIRKIDQSTKTEKSPEKNFITMLEFYAPWCG